MRTPAPRYAGSMLRPLLAIIVCGLCACDGDLEPVGVCPDEGVADATCVDDLKRDAAVAADGTPVGSLPAPGSVGVATYLDVPATPAPPTPTDARS